MVTHVEMLPREVISIGAAWLVALEEGWKGMSANVEVMEAPEPRLYQVSEDGASTRGAGSQPSHLDTSRGARRGLT